MPYAWEWIRGMHAGQLRGLYTVSREKSIHVQLCFPLEESLIIEYKKLAHSTSIECNDLNKSTIVEAKIMEVLSEDFEAIFADQKISLECFAYNVYDESLDPMLFECLEKVWKTSSKKVKTKEFRMETVDIKQGISLVQLLEPIQLKTIHLKIVGGFINSDDFLPLVSWKKEGRLILEFYLQNLTMECAVEVKKLLLHSSIFYRIIIIFLNAWETKDAIIEFFTPFAIEYRSDTQIILTVPEKSLGQQLQPANVNWLKVLGLRDVMETILADLNFFDVERLRITAKVIRHCVDVIKPDARIQVYTINANNFRTITTVELENEVFGMNTQTIGVYNISKQLEKLDKKKRDKPEELYRSHLVELPVFHSSFKTHLNHQFSCMKELKLIGMKLEQFKKIGNVLATRDLPLRVETLKMGVEQEDEIMQVLPYIDKNSLRNIHMGRSWIRNEVGRISVQDISGLEQWKNAEKLVFEKLLIDTPIQQMNLNNFLSVDIAILNITASDVFSLKEELLKRSNLQKWKIVFENDSIDETINMLMGDPHLSTETIQIWYFNYPNTDHSLKIRYVIGKAVFFTRILTSDI